MSDIINTHKAQQTSAKQEMRAHGKFLEALYLLGEACWVLAFLAGGQVLSRPSSRTCQCDSESPTPTSCLVMNCWVAVVCWCGYPYANITSSIGEDQCINFVEPTRSTAAECLVALHVLTLLDL